VSRQNFIANKIPRLDETGSAAVHVPLPPELKRPFPKAGLLKILGKKHAKSRIITGNPEKK
jgi:hypothetical protein